MPAAGPAAPVVVIDVGRDAPSLVTHLAGTGRPVVRVPVTTALADLVEVLDRAATDGTGVAVVASDADVSAAALDDVLADPRPSVRLLVDASSPADVGGSASGAVAIAGRRVTAAASGVHAVAVADGRSLGALSVPPDTIPALARAVAEAASLPADLQAATDPFDLLVVATVRHGIEVTAVPVQPLRGRRLTRLGPDPAAVGRADGPEVTSAGAGSDPATLTADQETDLRWQAASRADDGFFSTFVLRPTSRRLSQALHRRGWTPNRVTVTSALIGLAAATGFATGSTLGLVLGALALQVSLVFDCTDGEIARFTRTYTRAGAWLDATTDRVKEYLALAGLAIGAAREGTDIWLLAATAMAVQTVRHMQDFSFVRTVLAQWRAPVVDRRPLSVTDADPSVGSGGAATGETVLGASADRRRRIVFWIKRIIHLPIAERWLLLSVGALLGDPMLAVLLYLGADVVAWAWTTLGWVRRSWRTGKEVSPEAREVLRHYRDDGLVGRLSRPRGTATSSGSRRQTFAWIGPPAATAAECAAVLIATAQVDPAAGAWAFGWVAAVAWHRYDIVYRWRDWGERPSGAVIAAMLGWPVRFIVLLAAGILAASDQVEFVLVLGVGTVWFALVDLVALVPVVRRLVRAVGDAPSGKPLTQGDR